MRGTIFAFSLTSLVACSAADTGSSARPAPTAQGDQSDDSAEAPEETAVESLNPTLVVFTDPDTGFTTGDVYDATREIVHFDAEREAMVSATTGDSVSGWATDGNDLGAFGSFRVRFGSEDGQPRAYFTEAGNGTICNLVLSGPEMLDIYATSERPPMN